MGKQIKAVAFNFTRVLVGWDAQRQLRQFFTSDNEVDRFLEQTGLAGIRFAYLDSFRDKILELVKTYPEQAEALLYTVVRQDVWEVLRRLKVGGYRVYGMSNASARNIWLALWNELDDFIISEHAGVELSAPGIYQTLPKWYQMSPQECIFVDDDPKSLQAAAKAGMPTIHFRDVGQLMTELAGKYGLSIPPSEDQVWCTGHHDWFERPIGALITMPGGHQSYLCPDCARADQDRDD
jgi:haloacid dehalogenase superfamily, subfamily IA, variant 3 with third motif having DD or ED